MRNLENFLKSSILESLYTARQDDFQTLYIKRFRNEETNLQGNDTEDLLYEELNKFVPKESREVIYKRMRAWEDEVIGDNDTVLKRIYKLGFVDGLNFKEEIKNLEVEFNGKSNR